MKIYEKQVQELTFPAILPRLRSENNLEKETEKGREENFEM